MPTYQRFEELPVWQAALRARPGGNYVAEVPAIDAAVHLHPPHALARVHMLANKRRFDRLRKTRPAGAALEFVPAVEQRVSLQTLK